MLGVTGRVPVESAQADVPVKLSSGFRGEWRNESQNNVH